MNARVCVVDIETKATADPGVIRFLREGLKDEEPPAKIDSRSKSGRALERAGLLAHYKEVKNKTAWLEENWGAEEVLEARLAEEIEGTAVDPLFAEVIVAAFSFDEGEVHVISQTPEMEGRGDSFVKTERELLADLSTALGMGTSQETVWVGHNLAGFDVPVLMQAWRRHRLRAPVWFPSMRWGRCRGKVFDTMVECAARTPFTSAERAAAAFGIAFKGVDWCGTPMEGSRVGEAWAAGEIDLLREYCAADVAATRELARRMSGDWSALDRERIGAASLVQGDELVEIAIGAESDREKLVGVVEYLRGLGVIGPEAGAALLAG